MRVLLTSLGSRGDVEPLAGLAVALQALGAEAVVCAPGDAEFVGLLERARVPFAPAFMPIRELIASQARDPMPLPQRAMQVVPAQYDAIDAVAAGCDAVVATGLLPSVAASQCVAEARGLAYFHASFCPRYLPSDAHPPHAWPERPALEGADNRTLWAEGVEMINGLFGAAVNAKRAALGLAPTDNVRDLVFTREPLLASDPVIWPWTPTALCEPVQTGTWILPDDRPLAGDLEAFLQAGEAPVYVGFGSIATQDPKTMARVGIAAARAHGRRVVLARGWADLAPVDDGPDVFVTEEVNQQALFGRAAAVVHHGGAGTVVTAARAGAAQVIVPQIVDQPWWGARIAGLGLGAVHDGPVPTVESLAAALDIALTPQTQARAKAVAPRIRSDGATVAARRILDRLGRV
jgi:vancomycin aglycone glucosyltransferase